MDRQQQDVLKFLKSIRTERMEIVRLKEARNQLYYSLMPSGIRYDLDKVQTSPKDRMPAAAGELYEIQELIDKRIVKLAQDVNRAYQIVDSVPTPECRELLLLRYLMGERKPMTWKEIADEMGYSLDHVQGKLHGKAIREARIVWNKREQI